MSPAPARVLEDQRPADLRLAPAARAKRLYAEAEACRHLARQIHFTPERSRLLELAKAHDAAADRLFTAPAVGDGRTGEDARRAA